MKFSFFVIIKDTKNVKLAIELFIKNLETKNIHFLHFDWPGSSAKVVCPSNFQL